MIDKTRLRNGRLFDLIMSGDEAAKMITNGMTVACGGFTSTGCPKVVPLALARAAENASCPKITLLSGGSVGPEVEDELARVGVIVRRAPGTRAAYRHMIEAINSGDIAYYDYHFSHMAQMVDYGFLGPIDMLIIEATAITPDGHVIPTTSIGAAPIYARHAKKVIIEVNTTQPLELEGIHDIYIPERPPRRNPIPIYRTGDRIGTSHIEVGMERINAIVESEPVEPLSKFAEPNEESKRIAKHLIDFFRSEIRAGRLPQKLLPLQSGVGNISNAVLTGLVNSDFKRLEFFTELMQPAVTDLIEDGKVKVVSCSALPPDPRVTERLRKDPERYRDSIVLRPLDISNHPEVIRRLGVIALNAALEVDIYGHANCTHIMGTRMVNTIGGSGDFMRNGYLSIFTMPSTTKNDAISRIVSMVSHVDHTEHDWHVLITEQGVADFRGLSARERAQSIINNCAHPKYRPLLRDYFERAKRQKGHSPHILKEALSWHVRYLERNTMLA